MTRYLGSDGQVFVKWDDESEPVDWTTPNVGDGIDDEYCGNCAWDSQGCGCPRDPHYEGSDPRTLPVQSRDAPPIRIDLAETFTDPEQLLGGGETDTESGERGDG